MVRWVRSYFANLARLWREGTEAKEEARRLALKLDARKREVRGQ